MTCQPQRKERIYMKTFVNALGQPVGFPVTDWTRRQTPPLTPMSGRYCVVEPVDVERHAGDLYAANSLDTEGRNWTYLSDDAPPDLGAYRTWLRKMSANTDPQFHAVLDRDTGKALGLAALMRIDPAMGVIEVGHINFLPALQGTRIATEAIFLMMSRVFDQLGYRRFEWKCDSLNEPSRRAAVRFGFRFEGIFRQAVVYKNRNRDTAWYAIIDSDWPDIKAAFEHWLDPVNFDGDGRQRSSLSVLMKQACRGK